MESSRTHQPVLQDAALAALDVRPDGAYLDATFGRGGHARAILDCLGDAGRLVVVDRDPEAIACARDMLGGDGRVRIVREDFAMLAEIAAQTAPTSGFNGILIDLGVSSPQLDDPDRGFSFSRDGPLDMRMDPTRPPSAREWLASVEMDELARVLREFGEERHARRIARAIVAARDDAPIETTGQLARIVATAMPKPERDQHPATRTFQAIRICINRELESLDAVLAALPEALAPGGRAVVISFHSLEDRRVKQFFRTASARERRVERDSRGQAFPVAELQPSLRLVGRPEIADDAEARRNPRARSARMRVAEKVQ